MGNQRCVLLLLLLAVALPMILGCHEEGHECHHDGYKVFLDFINAVIHQTQDMLNDNHKHHGDHRPMDCADLDEQHQYTGIHTVYPRNRVMKGSPIKVMCDMQTVGGGWTLIQRRGDFGSSQDFFYRDWKAYKKGFGTLTQDFWIGLKNLYALTNQRDYILAIGMTDWEGNATYATYEDFYVDSEHYNYTLHVGGYRGNAGDSLSDHNLMMFSTKDRKNDKAVGSCAETFKGAWWYKDCHQSNLNGLYLMGHHDSFANGVNWLTFRGYNYSLKDVVMSIRPKNYRKKVKTEPAAQPEKSFGTAQIFF